MTAALQPRVRLTVHTLPSLLAVALFALMFAAGSLAYDGFFSGQVFLNLFIDNAFLIVVALGLSFVILGGGIDLSVGSVVALATMVLAALVERLQWPPLAAALVILLGGLLFGALQGVLVVYPHTSNWDFIVMILAKWSVGVPVRFWGKDSLFRLPLFGRWLRWLGGVPVARTSAQGVTTQALDIFDERRRSGRYFWLGLAPEGTRKYVPGLRSGFYRTALAAGVPLGLIRLDYGRREVTVRDFIALSGDTALDIARMAAVYQGVQGRVPAHMAPVKLLDPSFNRADTIVK